MPTVLLSVVTWNSAAVIEECLGSVLAQTYADFEVWVVDNASADDTCARVEAIAAADARVHLHRLPTNTGFCGGHNYALDRTHSEAALLVNPDIVMNPDYLERALAVLRADSSVGTVCGLLLQSRDADPRIDSAGMEGLPDGRYRLRFHGRLLRETPLEPGYVDGADGALPLYRRAFIDDLRVEGQFFDERFFAHKEDWDIAWRGSLYGWRTVFEPACQALHPREFLPSNLGRRLRLKSDVKADALKNQWLLLLKNPPRDELAAVWLRALPRQLGILLYCLLLERPSLCAFRYVWQHRADVLASRRIIQARAARARPVLPGSESDPPDEEADPFNPTSSSSPALGGPAPRPLLSICVPTYHRPGLLARALQSIGPLPPDVEIIVSDNSTANDECEKTARTVLASQPPGQWRYYRNPPGGNVTSNWNNCLRRARGHYVQMLHDDDYLLPSAFHRMLAVLRAARGHYEVVHFGVDVVTIDGHVVKQQRPQQARYFAPAIALEKVLSNSSYVRMPSLVASRRAYSAVGGPDPTQENTDDTDVWARLFARYGFYQVPECVACYTVHAGALTMGMFNEHIIELLLRIFTKASQTKLLPEPRFLQAQALFFHQFILAGAYRSIRRRNFAMARKVLRLFRHPALRDLRIPLLLLPVRFLLELILRLSGE